MSKIWSFMIIISIVFSIIMGNADKIIGYITTASMNAIENIITLAGMLCFWTGIFNILKATNVIQVLSGLLKPIFGRLLKKEEMNEEIIEDITLNVASNAIGIGNAATVYGINAIQKMQKINPIKQSPNDSMATFILLNTASIQLIPTTIISLRIIYGSVSPGKIILPVWISTLAALVVGLISIKILNKVIKQ